jgi:hypothetical protein
MEANAPRSQLPDDLSYVSSEAPALKDQQTSEPAPEPVETPVDADSTTSAEESSSWAWYAYVLSPALLLLVLLAVVPLTKRALVSRSRPEDLYRDLVGRLRDILPLVSVAGLRAADSPALTANERLLLLAGAAGIDEDPFREFARAYSESLYAPNPRSSMTVAYREALREYETLPRWKRALGAVNPASLLLRARRRLAASRARFGKSLRARARWLEGLRKRRR